MIKAIIINDNSILDNYYVVGQGNVKSIIEIEKNGEMATVPWYLINFEKDYIEINGKYVSRVIFNM